jgi:predicted DNA-binding transcriptional regulator AlpA
MPDNGSNRLIRRRQILEELGVDNATLWSWIKRGTFPEPLVLNPGQAREIVAWRQSDYLAWRQSLPQRLARSPRKTPYHKGVPRGPRQKKLIGRPSK